MKNDLKNIKKYYGEDMSKLCRSLFPTLLEKEGLLFELLSKNFYNHRFLVRDIIEAGSIERFREYIYSLIATYNNDEICVTENPFELMKKAGYTLYECHTEEDIQSFRKFYEEKEVLCTIENKDRLSECYVFFAVKDNIAEIKRRDKPTRQDEYGTSVISIQFYKGGVNDVSIKNRYNHTVNNPDATFGNNLNNIIVGLRKSFEQEYKLNITNSNNIPEFDLKNYYRATDGKYYKYTLEDDGTYYCPDNIIIKNNIPYQLEREKYILVENYLIDLVNKQIRCLTSNGEDSFTRLHRNISRICVEKDDILKVIVIFKELCEPIKIVINNKNEIIKYINNNVKRIGKDFLDENISLQEISMNKVKIVENSFLTNNLDLKILRLPIAIYMGHNCLEANIKLEEVDIPCAKEIGNYFACYSKNLQIINLPNVDKVGVRVFGSCEKIKVIEMSNLKVIDIGFLTNCNDFGKVNMPSLSELEKKLRKKF